MQCFDRLSTPELLCDETIREPLDMYDFAGIACMMHMHLLYRL